jgi:hypothetical protein
MVGRTEHCSGQGHAARVAQLLSNRVAGLGSRKRGLKIPDPSEKEVQATEEAQLVVQIAEHFHKFQR